MAKNTTKKITSIGGSALIEGIMMRGPKRTTVCVRTAPDKIYSEDISINTIPSKCKLFKLPFLRGIAGLIDSMRLSYKALMPIRQLNQPNSKKNRQCLKNGLTINSVTSLLRL